MSIFVFSYTLVIEGIGNVLVEQTAYHGPITPKYSHLYCKKIRLSKNFCKWPTSYRSYHLYYILTVILYMYVSLIEQPLLIA